MKVVYGDIWQYPADVVCVTTNGSVKKNGEAVMGRGVAAQAKERWPWLPRALGYRISQSPYMGPVLERFTDLGCLHPHMLVAFPVKHTWRDRASLPLIRQSARLLGEMAKQHSDWRFVLPRPGCGNGGQAWQDVEPLLLYLPDNVHVIGVRGWERDSH